MTGVGGAGEHGISATDFAGEEYAVPVVGQEGVLLLVENLEILGPGHADGGAVIAVAPGHPVFSVDEGYARVIAVDPLTDLGAAILETDGLRFNVPVDAVLGESGMEGHAAVGVVAAEYAGESVSERDDGTVEDAIGVREQVPGNHGIGAVSPQGRFTARGTLFPGKVGQGCSLND